ncbi:MAG: hypothetical protein ACI8XV_002889 [Arenicella sp.]|jgi:hypothetical protein
MNWDAIGALSELVGATAVVVTLLYLSVQLRQNTKATRLSSTQSLTEELQDMFNLLSSDESLAEIFVEAAKSSNISGVNQVRYYCFNSNILRVYENAFLQRQGNASASAHWEGMTRMMIDFTKMVAFASYWENRKHWLSEDFQQYMESEIINADQKPGVEIPGGY